MTTQVERHYLSIHAINVPRVLADLRTIYPDIKDLNYESDASNLQYLLSILGFHVRVNIDESIFTISRLPEKEDTKGDPYTTLECISKYLPTGGFIDVDIDGKKFKFTNTEIMGEQSSIEKEIEKSNVMLESLLSVDIVDPIEGEISRIYNTEEIKNETDLIIEDLSKNYTTEPVKRKGRPKKL